MCLGAVFELLFFKLLTSSLVSPEMIREVGRGKIAWFIPYPAVGTVLVLWALPRIMLPCKLGGEFTPSASFGWIEYRNAVCWYCFEGLYFEFCVFRMLVMLSPDLCKF